MAKFLGDAADESVERTKRALLASLAEGKVQTEAFGNRASDVVRQVRQSGLTQAAARGAAINAPQALQADISQGRDALLGVFADDALREQATSQRELDRIAAANVAYLDQLKAAIPLQQQLIDASRSGVGSGGGGGGGGGGSGSGGGGGGGLIPVDAPAFDSTPLSIPELKTPAESLAEINPDAPDSLIDVMDTDEFKRAERIFADELAQGHDLRDAQERFRNLAESLGFTNTPESIFGRGKPSAHDVERILVNQFQDAFGTNPMPPQLSGRGEKAIPGVVTTPTPKTVRNAQAYYGTQFVSKEQIESQMARDNAKVIQANSEKPEGGYSFRVKSGRRNRNGAGNTVR